MRSFVLRSCAVRTRRAGTGYSLGHVGSKGVLIAEDLVTELMIEQRLGVGVSLT